MDNRKNSSSTGLIALLGTTLLWGSSFPAIKVVTGFTDSLTYTWVRGLISAIGLFPVVIYYIIRNGSIAYAVKAGLITGSAYAVGIWLQGWGTALTTASNAAFITGLNVVIVYGIDALIKKERYGLRGLTSLFLSLAGLYLLSGSLSKMTIGDLLVLASAFLFALQVELIHKYSSSNPVIFTFFEMLPMTSFVIIDYLRKINYDSIIPALPSLIYLGLICNDVALSLQVFGQRWFEAYEAALIYLLEPVFGALFSFLIIGETVTLRGAFGAALILSAMVVATAGRRKASS